MTPEEVAHGLALFLAQGGLHGYGITAFRTEPDRWQVFRTEPAYLPEEHAPHPPKGFVAGGSWEPFAATADMIAYRRPLYGAAPAVAACAWPTCATEADADGVLCGPTYTETCPRTGGPR